MFPAARKGDPITHDLLVPSGIIGPPVAGPCPKGVVLIEGLPAAHLNCTVVCTGAISVGLAHPPPPAPPPPPIIMGSPTVLIHGMPAARWAPSGDTGACGVFLGDPKLAATRRVLIGGPVFPLSVTTLPNGNIQVGNNITIAGDREFQAKVLRDLHIMSSFPTGASRLSRIDSSGRAVEIRPGANNTTTPDNNADAAAAGRPAWGGTEVGTGRGTGSTITYNPDREPPTAADPSVRRPADVGLHHELTHADRMAHGEEDASPDPAHPNNPNLEETQVINQDNQYRIERGIPTRADHTVL